MSLGIQGSIQLYTFADASFIRVVKGTSLRHSFPYHVHDSFCIGFVEKGSRYIRTKNEAFDVTAGGCFVINPNQPHSCSSSEVQGHDYWVVLVKREVVVAAFRESTDSKGNPWFDETVFGDDQFFTMGLDLVYELQESGFSVTQQGQLSSLLEHLVSRYARERLAVGLGGGKHKHYAVGLTRQYIDNNLSRNIQLEELAGVVGLSPCYLNRVFREIVGIPPHMYLLQRRIKKALELLARGSLVAETAYHLGFCDQSHFTRLFKRDVGIPPGRYIYLQEETH